MAMLTIECHNCKSIHSLRGWVEKEDLIGTKYEHLINTITEEELQTLYKKGEVKDPWDKYSEKSKCPDCGSKNVVSW